ncbi:bifunctional phosphoribosyl-AMP cyclohydrolase/phosphoribosyl-ATP diphosphatase HisIE [Candidatus Gracilibacteria bacterium]|nr:bifunctional phosphoribosyl-AMP cyclohydrolase/phosphoribosyl-ATP diphosphatase HisIE [Candidatus Gracilibacteria bacterium]
MKTFNIDFDTLNFQKNNGLITAVVQDSDSGTVLMVGYQNRKALEQTMKTCKITFWSRTKERLWTKGEESGNFLEMKDAQVDCDQDTILYLAKAPKATCHTGKFSCFGEESSFGFLSKLFRIIQDRKKNMPEGSYVTSLFNKGLERIAQKVGEEGVETVIAALSEEKAKFISESADLLFHYLVLLEAKETSLEVVLEELKKRHKE